MPPHQTYTETWCEWYCAETCSELRAVLEHDGDHSLDYPDQYPRGTPDQIPTITHEISNVDPDSQLSQLLWTPRDGWGYYLHSDHVATASPRPMGIAVDEHPGVVAERARQLALDHAVGLGETATSPASS